MGRLKIIFVKDPSTVRHVSREVRHSSKTFSVEKEGKNLLDLQGESVFFGVPRGPHYVSFTLNPQRYGFHKELLKDQTSTSPPRFGRPESPPGASKTESRFVGRLVQKKSGSGGL